MSRMSRFDKWLADDSRERQPTEISRNEYEADEDLIRAFPPDETHCEGCGVIVGLWLFEDDDRPHRSGWRWEALWLVPGSDEPFCEECATSEVEADGEPVYGAVDTGLVDTPGNRLYTFSRRLGRVPTAADVHESFASELRQDLDIMLDADADDLGVGSSDMAAWRLLSRELGA